MSGAHGNPFATIGFVSFVDGWKQLGYAVAGYAAWCYWMFGFYIEPHVVKKTFEDALKEISYGT